MGGFMPQIIGLLLLVSVLIWQLSPKGVDALAKESTGLGQGVFSTEYVVKAVSVMDSVVEPGAVGTLYPARLSSRISSLIQSMPVDVGSWVKVGDPLVILDTEQTRILYRRALSELQRAEFAHQQSQQQAESINAGLNFAKMELQRTEALVKQKLASEEALDEIRSRYLQLDSAHQAALKGVSQTLAQISVANEALKETELQLQWCIITAPFDGLITARMAHPGEMAIMGQPLVVLENPQQKILLSSIRSQFFQKIGLGDSLKAKFLEQECLGEVIEISPSLNPSTQTFGLKVLLSKDCGVALGTFGHLLIPGSQKSVVRIPKNFVTTSGNITMVNVKGPNGVDKRMIRIADLDNQKVLVLDGLKENEVILK